MLLCIGPEGSGKTLLLRRLANLTKTDLNLTTVPTVGMNITTITQGPDLPSISIRELGEHLGVGGSRVGVSPVIWVHLVQIDDGDFNDDFDVCDTVCVYVYSLYSQLFKCIRLILDSFQFLLIIFS